MLDFKLPDDDDCQEVRDEVQLKDQSGSIFYEKLTFIYLEMPNFVKNETELVSNFDKWMFVLKNLSALKDRPSALQDRIFQRLFDSAEIAKFTPEEAIKYQESLKNYRDWKNTIDTSFDEGKEIGRSEATINFARQLKAYGDPIDKIIQLTGLSAEEIDKL